MTALIRIFKTKPKLLEDANRRVGRIMSSRHHSIQIGCQRWHLHISATINDKIQDKSLCRGEARSERNECQVCNEQSDGGKRAEKKKKKGANSETRSFCASALKRQVVFTQRSRSPTMVTMRSLSIISRKIDAFCVSRTARGRKESTTNNDQITDF